PQKLFLFLGRGGGLLVRRSCGGSLVARLGGGLLGALFALGGGWAPFALFLLFLSPLPLARGRRGFCCGRGGFLRRGARRPTPRGRSCRPGSRRLRAPRFHPGECSCSGRGWRRR